MNLDRLLDYEKTFWGKGVEVFGIDEAGVGCGAGSMWVAGVSFEPMEKIPLNLLGIRDSKKMSESNRFRLEPLIKEKAKFWFCQEVTVDKINQSDNTYWLRFRTAEEELSEKFASRILGNVVVYDGNKSLRLDDAGCDSRCLVKGDNISFSIAAASILAKSAKDREMILKAIDYPEYGFEQNKGYLTKLHRNALVKSGACKEHRIRFCKKYIK